MRATIFANGTIKDDQWIQSVIHSSDMIIAANGGALHCLDMGLLPSTIVGDLDSLSPEQKDILQTRGTKFIVYPRMKDQTDLELALTYAITSGANEIILVGFMGGRLDQTIANLLLITRPDWDSANLRLINGRDHGYLVRSGDSLVIHGGVGETVSLIPLSTVVDGITTSGLRWSLKKSNLKMGSTLGISNELSDNRAIVRIDQGKLLVVHNKKID